MRLTASATRVRWIRLLICLSLLAQSLIPAAAAAPAVRTSGKTVPAAGAAAARQEAEAADLPDIEEVRSRPHREPKAVPPVPSTRRRCPPRNPRCNDEADGAPAPTPTPAPPANRPPRGNAHSAAAHAGAAPGTPAAPAGVINDIASATSPSYLTLLSSASNGSRPLIDLSLLDFITSGGGHSVSDAPARLMPGAVYAAAPAPMPAAFFQQGGVNVAAASSGATATGSTSYDSYGLSASRAIDGSRTYAGYYWNDQTPSTFPDWLQVNFAGARTIGEVSVFFLQDNYGTAEPTEAMTFTQYGVTAFDVQYWNGSAWATVPGGGVAGNNKVWRKFTFSPVTTDKIRVVVNAATDGWSRIVEVEAYNPSLQPVAPQGITPAESVAWTNAVGVTASGSGLTKVAASGWDAGAMSTKAIASGDGYAEFTVPDTNTNRMFGLSHGDSDQSYADVDFAVHTQAGGALYAFEAGVNRGQFGTCVAGDRLRVSVAGGTVSYSKNGVTFYTSAAAPRYPLLVDASLYEQGATLNNALISGSLVDNVVWSNVAGVTAAGNNLAKGGAAGWNNGGASSTRVIAGGDGYAEFTATETNTYRMFGLSRGDSSQDYADIDFAIYPAADGNLYVYEAGVYKAHLGGYAAGDRLRVSVEGGQVRYRRNGALLYTSATPPQYPLLVDTAFYSTGSTVFNAVISAPLPSQTDPGGIGLTGRYYDNLDFTGYKLSRLDYTIDYWWDLAAPAPGVGSEEFSVRWTGMVVPRHSETYTFYTTSDDGVRLWVDGQLIINKWLDQGATEWTGQITLEAGRAYSIKMEFYDRFWGAVAKLAWSSASQAKEIVPQSRLLPCWKPTEQFVADFYQAALRRRPTSYESQDWTERLAQAQGEGQLIAAAQALGRTLFNSQEYAALNPSDNRRFVSDLYWGYLQRAPDAGGWSWWEGEVNAHGRGHGIASFEDSIEFKEKVARLCGVAASSDANAGDGYNFAAARLDPSNRTGGGGADPYSRNYNFQIPLASLAGRAGLDLGLALSYNSLVWTKDGSGVTFDADRGTPSPGFRLGFPVLQPKFYNPQTQKYAYLLVTPGGARVELRQVGASNVYEAADSSYLQLTEGAAPTLLAADGTQLSFAAAGGEWRCQQVRDRNGNYISAAYYGDGRISQVTDTLGRVITFNYDNYQNLLSITQPWRRDTETNPSPAQDEAHQWATFGYTNVTLQPSFSNLAVVGEQPGTVIPSLNQVGLDDGSYFRFYYNQWGQVWKVTHFAADSVSGAGVPNDSHPLTTTRLDLPGSDLAAASPQTDCPRFTQERTWVENGVMNQSAEVTATYDQWSPNMASCEVTAPDGTKQVSFYGGAYPWQKGLVTSSEERSGGQTMKTTALTWEHDGAANASAFVNPRVAKTTVSDPQGNSRTTRVTYTAPPDFQVNNGYAGSLNLRLPRKVEACADVNCSNVLRTTVNDYSVPSLDQYVARRILGLARNRYVYEGAESPGNLRSRVEYHYDQANDLQDTFLAALPSAAAQHDAANYGASLTRRGNANRVWRYSVDQTSGAVGSYVETRAAYNVTGTVAYAKDALGHRNSVGYADSFFQNINRTHPDPAYRLQTYAYPTVVTDAENFTSTASYNYDLGVVRESQTPLPNVTTNQPGPLGRFFYDAAGRVVKSLSVNTSAYTRSVYPAKMDAVQSYKLVEAGVEVYSAEVLDGAGRTRAAAWSLPGSAGGYAGQFFDYDQMGRLARRSNPTETSASGATWSATGDDAANGWLYTQTSYDWKGRPLVVTHPKVNPADPNEQPATRLVEYGGCGCAGGEVVTERSELVPIPGTTSQGRRAQKTYSDVFGRPWKTESLDWDGNVYATTTTKYDALDRAVRERQYAGAAPAPEPAGEGGGYQTTTMAYDGLGRLQSRHAPDQDAAASTVFTYNADDTPLNVTDGRGAVTTFTRNARHLVTGVTHALAGSPTVTSSYQYDAAGNRTRMDDAQGWQTYGYDALSRMSSETRYFSALGASYTLSYPTYTLAGQLKSLTDPFGAQFNYTFDSAGRVTAVTGSAYAGVTSYASNVQYRAWGGVKSASFGDGSAQTTAYDGQMRPSQYRLTAMNNTNWQRLDYAYNADGNLRQLTDLDDGPGATPPSSLHFFSVSYRYDHLGRTLHGGGVNGSSPYQQDYAYDAFDNMTTRTGTYGYNSPTVTDTATYVNDRRQGWTYDADGRLTLSPANSSSNQRNWSYDAAGRLTQTTETSGTTTDTLTLSYDGEGRTVREAKTGGVSPGTYYMVRSTVLGGEVVTRLTAAGAKAFTYVPTGGIIGAQQGVITSNNQAYVNWAHRDPSGTSEPGAAIDPLDNYVRPVNPQPAPTPPSTGMYGPSYFGAGSSFGNAANYSTGCTLDGQPWNCNSVQHAIQNGSAVPCRDNYCGPRNYIINGVQVWVVPMGGNNAWVSDGSDSVYIDLGDFEYRYAGDPNSWAMNYAGGADRPKKKGKKRTTQTKPDNTTGRAPTPLEMETLPRYNEVRTIQPTPAQVACDQKLGQTFGGKGALAAGSGFDPKGHPTASGSLYRGDYIDPRGLFSEGHLGSRAMHMYGAGGGITDVIIPGGGTYLGKNPNSNENSYMFYYKRLGNETGVTLFTAHIADFILPAKNTYFANPTRIGRIGGVGGEGGKTEWPHAHFAMHKGRGYTGNRLSFFQVFCTP